jgi:HD superfamily phosphohydrolase
MKENTLLEYLETDFDISIRDPLWQDIKLSDAIYSIYMTKQVQKLSRIKQLGPTNLIYPGAMHTRLCHSLGVYHLSKEIIKSLLSKPIDNHFTLEGINSFLAAALLHDIGHFPYTHSLKELPLIDHEILATQIINGDNELNSVLKQENFNLEKICNILNFEEEAIDNEIKFYKSLLSGALDPDKLDYLNRDAFFSGVTYGLQDCSFIISHLTISNSESTLLESAILSLEHLLFSKYQMYQTIYWHKRTRCATAMIKKCLIYNLEKGIIKGEDLYNLDDYSFIEIAQNHSSTFLNVLDVNDNKLLKTKYEKPFDKTNKLHYFCLDLENRTKAEKFIFNLLKDNYPNLREEQLIIDIPEPISFEVDIPILFKNGEVTSFKDLDGIFSNSVIKGFEKALRKVRIFTIDEISINEIEEAINRWAKS